jgi:hypothetical protein
MGHMWSYKKPRPLVNVTARTSGWPLRPANVGVEESMVVGLDCSVGADGLVHTRVMNETW